MAILSVVALTAAGGARAQDVGSAMPYAGAPTYTPSGPGDTIPAGAQQL